MKYYFSFPELIKTDTKLKNCPRKMEEIANLLKLASVLTYVRELCGFPIIVNSAYRTPEVNSLVGGVVNSLHMHGRAADITCNPLQFDELVAVGKCLDNIGLFHEFIVKSNFIHVAI